MNFISFKKFKKLNENVEFLIDENKVKHHFRDDDLFCYAFGYIEDKLVLSPNRGSHGDAIFLYLDMRKSDIDYDFFDKIYKKLKYEGRIWINYETISFRDSYVPEHIINKLKIDLQKYFPGKNFDNFKIEIR